MAKIGYIMATAHYDKLEEDRQWMQQYGCVKIVEENDADEKSRPLWKQLMIALERGDELVISKYSNAIRGARELAMFLEFCRVKVIRVISIHDRIDSKNELFPETKPSDVLLMIGSLPDEALVLRKSSEHVSKLQERMIVQLPPISTAKATSDFYCKRETHGQGENSHQSLCSWPSDRRNLESKWFP